MVFKKSSKDILILITDSRRPIYHKLINDKSIFNEESFNASSSEESNEEYDEYEEEEDEENSLSDNIIKDKNIINQKSIFKMN